MEKRTREIAARLHTSNPRAMAPITLTTVAAVIVYTIFVFHMLRPPQGLFHFMVLFKIILCFLIIGIPNTIIFEMWVRRKLIFASRVLAWEGNENNLTVRGAIESTLALIDFPHQFIVRFMIQWLIASPIIVALLMVFYELPVGTLIYMAMGVAGIMCLMGTFHYFVIKATYAKPVIEALAKIPNYYERAELARRRIKYRNKILVYILVLVGSVTWISTHLSIAVQTRSVDIQRDQYLGQRIESSGIANAFKYRTPGASELEAKVYMMLTDQNEEAYLIDGRGDNLLDKDVDPIDRRIMDQIPQVSGPQPSYLTLEYWKQAFKPRKPMVIKITDRVMHAYADGREYTVTVDQVGGNGNEVSLVTVQSQTRGLMERARQMSAVIGMFVIALILSVLFARFMQWEIMSTLSRIIDSSVKVAGGDLSNPEPIMADDEFGEMAVYHLKMVASLRAMVGQISDAAKGIDEALTQIAGRTEEMSTGSEAQSVSVEQTTAAITEMNQTIGNIADSVDTLASSAEESSASIIQMSATNEEVANSSEDLSSAVVETTASVQEMSASVKEVADNVQNTQAKAAEAANGMRQMREAVKRVDRIASDSAKVSEQVAKDSTTGGQSVQTTIKGIGQIWESSQEAAHVIERLSKRAKEIGRILTVIEEVTEETNLLALNAAIIAAQAGEHGKGFAVVADEIKDLAERTQASTTEIAEQIRAVQDEAKTAVETVEAAGESVSKGVLLAEEAGEALNKIQDSSKRSLDLAREISEAMVDQSRKADHILNFFENIVSMIEQIGTATQEQTRGSEQILLAAERMRDIATQVKKATREQSIGGKQISQSMEHITQIANYINNSQGEQRKAAQQVLIAMSQIAEIASSNVQGVDKVSDAVNNLAFLADGLKAMLDSFQTGDETDNGGF